MVRKMAKYRSLYSSSKGNSHLLSAKGWSIVIDVGVSCKKFLEGLAISETSLSTLGGILITHEHIDHVKGLEVLLKKHPIPIYGSTPTIKVLQDRYAINPSLLNSLDKPMEIAGMEVIPFSVSHDCIAGQGYRIKTSDNKIFSFATDLGCVSQGVIDHMEGANMAVIESNYCPNILKNSSYPPALKARIASSIGHLSNGEAAKLSAKLVKGSTTRITYAHLSQENNLPQVAYNTTVEALKNKDMIQGNDYLLHIASPSEPSPWSVF